MEKNVASQSIGAQMITAADGSDFTGTVTVLITVDNGTQSASGGTAPAHEGNGYHSYTPTQAETNGNHVAFTFTGTGAITTTVQVFTTPANFNLLVIGGAGRVNSYMFGILNENFSETTPGNLAGSFSTRYDNNNVVTTRTLDDGMPTTHIAATGGVVDADIKKINSVTVNGAGTAGDLWEG